MQKIANYLVEQGVDVAIATDELCDSNSLAGLNPVIEMVTRRREIGKLCFAKSLLAENYTFYVGVQSHNACWLALAKMISLKNSKIVSWEHSSPVTSLINEHGCLWPLYFLVKSFLGFFVNAFLCVSRGGVDELSRFLPIKRASILYAPNIIYDSSFENSKKAKNSDNEKLTFLSVGRVSKEKGLPLALDALKGLSGINWTYLVVGDGPQRIELEAICRDDDLLNDRVNFIGWATDVNKYFELADALLLPSYYEGMPTVLVEASVFGIPLIASNCRTGPSEIIQNGQNGYLFPVGRSDLMREAILKFIASRGIIKNSVEYVRDFSRDSAGNRFFCLLKQI